MKIQSIKAKKEVNEDIKEFINEAKKIAKLHNTFVELTHKGVYLTIDKFTDVNAQYNYYQNQLKNGAKTKPIKACCGLHCTNRSD